MSCDKCITNTRLKYTTFLLLYKVTWHCVTVCWHVVSLQTHLLYPTYSHILIIFWWDGVWTQGFVFTKRALYHLSHTSSPVPHIIGGTVVLIWLLSLLVFRRMGNVEAIIDSRAHWDPSDSRHLLELWFWSLGNQTQLLTLFLLITVVSNLRTC
jgi:hypothetical protein